MKITTVSSRDFARDHAAAKRAAADGPVFITDRGRPAYALLRIEDYRRLAGQPAQSLLAALQEGAPIVEDAGHDLDFPRFDLKILPKPPSTLF
ncbi:MAG: type II toxin-antitoxin system prevent-host-death family antitoxin [Lautropia sp.]